MSQRRTHKRAENPGTGLRVLRWVFLGACVVLALLSLRRAPKNAGDAAPASCARVLKARTRLRGVSATEWDGRSALYRRMLANVARDGVTLVSRAGGTQGLSVSEMFSYDQTSGTLQPRLRLLTVPVRAIVVPLPASATAVAAHLAQATSSELLPVLGPDGVWLQDPEAYHMSLFHASHHMHGEVPKSPAEVDAEADAVLRVVNRHCAIRAMLERVLVTRGGVVMGVWNVVDGAQPAAIRALLRAAVPEAPTQLVSDHNILHMTLARAIAVPDARALTNAVDALSKALCGMEITFDTVWYAEERHALALALRGDYRVRSMPMKLCFPHVGGKALDAGG